ncbi:hypothetical protein OXX69_004044 [Metschnikowia pulcherrima]
MSPNSRDSKETLKAREKRMAKALAAYKSGDFSSVAKAAKAFDVPTGTLQHRLKGRKARFVTYTKNHKLQDWEEAALKMWILQRDDEGKPTLRFEVEEVAKSLLSERGSSEAIGKDWIKQLTVRQPELSTEVSRGFICRSVPRARRWVIREWLDTYKETIEKHAITKENVYKLDISGTQSGPIASITNQGVNKGINHIPKDWVTILECFSASGEVIPPYLGFRGRLTRDYIDPGVSHTWEVKNVRNHWRNDQIVADWVSIHFNRATKTPYNSSYRLLLIDGHKCKETEELKTICRNEKIIPIFIPRALSYLFHGLDFFSMTSIKGFHQKTLSLKRNLPERDEKMIFESYEKWRKLIFADAKESRQNLRSRFRACGLFPFESEKIMKKVRETHSKTQEGPNEESNEVFQKETQAEIQGDSSGESSGNSQAEIQGDSSREGSGEGLLSHCNRLSSPPLSPIIVHDLAAKMVVSEDSVFCQNEVTRHPNFNKFRAKIRKSQKRKSFFPDIPNFLQVVNEISRPVGSALKVIKNGIDCGYKCMNQEIQQLKSTIQTLNNMLIERKSRFEEQSVRFAESESRQQFTEEKIQRLCTTQDHLTGLIQTELRLIKDHIARIDSSLSGTSSSTMNMFMRSNMPSQPMESQPDMVEFSGSGSTSQAGLVPHANTHPANRNFAE